MHHFNPLFVLNFVFQAEPKAVNLETMFIIDLFLLLIFHPYSFNKMISSTKKHLAAFQEERQHQVGLPKKVIGKELHLINDQWKYSSTLPRSPSAIIGTSPKELPPKSNFNVPGPGQYDFTTPIRHKINQRNKAIKFTTQTSTKFSLNVPNNQGSSKKNILSIDISQNKKSHKFLKGSFTTETYQGISFPKQTRENLQNIENRDKIQLPGPGKYKQIESKSHKNAFSFMKSKKFCQQEKELSEKGQMPAPGKYELSESRKQLKGIKFSRALRMTTEINQVPGPASHYSVADSSLSHRGGTIDKQKRENLYDTETPGPGSYERIELNKIKRKESRTVIGRSSSKDIKSNISIGPGSYFRQKTYQKEKIIGGTIDKSLRTSSVTEAGPGPLYYNINYRPILTQSKNVVFGKQMRQLNAKIILPKRKKDKYENSDLRMSSNVNNKSFIIKDSDRKISRTSISHY